MTSHLVSITVLLASLVSPSLIAEDAATIYMAAGETEKIAAKEGQKITVYGTTKNCSKSASGTNYVNFDNTDFYLVTFASDVNQFKGGEPHELYDGKRIAVSGVISIYKDKPQIKLTSPEQIQILAEDEVFPPAADEEPAPEKETPAAMKKEPLTPQKPSEEEPKRKPPVDAKKYFK